MLTVSNQYSITPHSIFLSVTMNKQKIPPIIELFRDAGRLANEWRDTLFYGIVAAGTVVNACLGNPLPENFVPLAVTSLATSRELARAISWRLCPVKSFAGTPLTETKSIDKCRLAAAVSFAVAAGCFASAYCYALAPNPSSLLPMIPFLYKARQGVIKIGGIKETIETFNYIWDWPRKKDGGEGQTEKFKNGVHTCGKKLNTLPKAFPQPI